MIQHVLFEAGGLALAVPAHRVRVIHEQLSVESIIGTCDWFLGLAVSRGRLLPISDLGLFIGRQACRGSTLELEVEASVIALRVGAIAGVYDLTLIDDDQPVEGAAHIRNLTLTGKMVCTEGQAYRVLDVAALVDSLAFTLIRDTVS